MSSTGFAGLDLMIREAEFPPYKQTDAYRILIRGVPGTGKTTLGLKLIHEELKHDNSNGLIVYCQEDLQQLDSLALQFNLKFKKCSPDALRVSIEEFKNGFPRIKQWINDKLSKNPDVAEPRLSILIDGLSFVKSSNPENVHGYLMNLMTEVPYFRFDKKKRAKLLLIVITEENIFDDHSFEHLVDGVINLSIDKGYQRHRFFEISKLRYIDQIRGRHGFQIFQNSDGKSTIEILPRPSTYIGNTYCSQNENFFKKKSNGINSGINGLEEILVGSDSQRQADTKPLKAGDVFFITAEPGVNKNAISKSFLKPASFSNNSKTESGVWVSFSPLQMSQLFENDKNVKIIERTDISIHPDKIVSSLVENIKSQENILQRIVIEGLSNIGREFNNQEIVDRYVIWIAKIIKKFNMIGIIFIDLPSSFTPLSDIDMKWGACADFIGHLRWFEINNHLSMSFALSKSKYSKFNSIPFYVSFSEKNKQEIFLEDRGWPMINMLSGRMDTIREAKVFLKFFDQNYSTRKIHLNTLTEFKKRYSKDQEFTHVIRSSPTPKHWSFRGYAGAGHSNTKVVCLKQYIMNVLAEDQVLIDFPPDEFKNYSFQAELKYPSHDYRKAKAYNIWGLTHLSEETNKKQIRNMIPLYADIGVLCGQTNLEKLRQKAEKEKEADIVFAFTSREVKEKCGIPDSLSLESILNRSPDEWGHIFTMNNIFQELKSIDNNFKIRLIPPWIKNVFAMPSISQDSSGFMAFFLEVLFDIASKDENNDFILNFFSENGYTTLEKLIKAKNGFAFIETINFMRKLVIVKASANPLEKVHYHTALFSRRWFSKVDQYPQNDPRMPEIEKYIKPPSDPEFKENDYSNLKERFDFKIFKLPTCSSNKQGGLSCFDIYSLGVIKGALAPETAWMFISELTTSTNDTLRFDQRRGLPIRREHWSTFAENKQRENDKHVIDSILDNNRYFSNFWIPSYWDIESKLNTILRKM